MNKLLPVLFLLCVSLAAYGLNTRFTLIQTPDGYFRTADPTGSTPSPATLAWDEACLTSSLSIISNQYIGTATSINVRTCLIGTGAASAVITESGGVDWSISTNNLVHAGSNVGSGSLTLTATQASNVVLSSARNWGYSASPGGSDTTAPPIPGGLISTGTNVNQVSLEFDSVCDAYDGVAASGTKQYNVRVGATAVETFLASSCATGQLTQTIIGTSDGTPSSSQNDNTWNLSFGGAGTGGTTHNLLLVGRSLSGTYTISGKITSLVSAASFEKVGLGFFASTETSARYCGIHWQGTDAIQMHCRPTDSANRVSVASQAITLPVDIRITKTDTSVSTYYSTSGGAWIELGTYSIVLPENAIGGTYITSNSAGTNATATIENLNFSNLGRVSRNVTTALSGSFTVSADDNIDNESAFSSGVTASPVAPPASTGIKWHPGHYMLTYLGSSSQWMSQIDAICSATGIKGVVIRLYWAQLESTQGNYAAGISLIRSYLDRLEACGTNKRLILTILDRKFSGTATPSTIIPSYVINGAAYEGGVYVASDRVTARVWDADVVDRMIALSDALAVEFDDEPYFEAVGFEGETALGGTISSAPGWSQSAYHAQLKRLMTAMRASWERTGLRVYANYHSGGQSNLPDLIAHAQSLDFMWGDPDLLPNATYPGDSSPAGPTDGQRTIMGTIGGIDYRGAIAHGPDNQSPVYGGKEGSYLPSEIRTYANSITAHYVMWIRGVTSAASFNRSDMSSATYLGSYVGWDDMLTFLNANSLTNTACPSNMICDTN